MLRLRSPASTTRSAPPYHRGAPGVDPTVVGKCARALRSGHQPCRARRTGGGIPERGAKRLALVRDLPLLSVESAIAEIVQAYIRHKLMPADPGGDALHLALASYHKCDFLVTWNCQHLANANKFGHIRRVNAMLGLFVPALVTPLELLGGSDEAESE